MHIITIIKISISRYSNNHDNEDDENVDDAHN